MILFKTLRWKNLLSTGNHFTELKLNSNTNTLVVGTNGSGKSTMMKIIMGLETAQEGFTDFGSSSGYFLYY